MFAKCFCADKKLSIEIIKNSAILYTLNETVFCSFIAVSEKVLGQMQKWCFFFTDFFYNECQEEKFFSSEADCKNGHFLKGFTRKRYLKRKFWF